METECKAQDNAISSSSLLVRNCSELLGSVTQQPDSEGGIQLRTSARVSKKLKLDSQQAQTLSDKKEVNHEEEKKMEVPASTEGKPRAKRVDWLPEDKFAFFEALNEYGKDIDAIHNHLIQKAKRRGGQEAKTKDQVRFFYYRMWSILSKHISFPPYMKKQTQELYALINFGELRKKISLSNKKHYQKLSEMIYSGSTQLKFRGKVRKVRTPLCKALRKLNLIEESSEELRLPSCVTVELRPRYTEDWCRVQALAQNPRVRSLLPLQRRLESLIAFLHRRWQTEDNKLREQLEGSSEVEGREGILRVGPRPGTTLTKPTVRLSEVATSSKLSLMAYEERFHTGAKQVPTLLEQLPVIHRNKGRGVKRQRTDSVSEKTAREGEEIVEVEMAAADPSESHSAVTQPLSLHCITDNAQPDTVSPRVNGELLVSDAVVDEEVCEDATRPDPHLGWTLETAGATRIGDLYMMFGMDAKIQLDYWWERCGEGSRTAPLAVSVAGPVSGSPPVAAPADSLSPTTPSLVTSPPMQAEYSTLAITLQKLLSVAKLEMFKSKSLASNQVGSDSKVHSTKPRLHKPKAHQENVQKVDTQLKFQVCPLPLDEVFRRPIVAPSSISIPTKSSDTLNLDKMRPRWCNRRGRPRRQPPTPRQGHRVVPLLPKVPPSISLIPAVAKHPSLFSQVTRPGFKPIAPAPPLVNTVPEKPVPTPSPITIDVLASVVSPSPNQLEAERDRAPSPSSLSNLLEDLSLPSIASSRLSTPVPTFEGLLGSGEVNAISPCSSKDQWINSEMTDLSLSEFSFLNSLDSNDMKPVDDTRLSDGDSQMRNLINTDNMTDLNDFIANLSSSMKTNKEPD